MFFVCLFPCQICGGGGLLANSSNNLQAQLCGSGKRIHVARFLKQTTTTAKSNLKETFFGFTLTGSWQKLALLVSLPPSSF